MDFLHDDDFTDEEMGKDQLLMKCKEVIESLNSEIEEERIAFKILKEETDRLKTVDLHLQSSNRDNQELNSRVNELEHYLDSSKANTHTFLDRLNADAKTQFQATRCYCNDIRDEGFPMDYKCANCLLSTQINEIKSQMSEEIKHLKDIHKEEIQNRDYKFSNQTLQLKSVVRDLSKANQEVEKLTDRCQYLSKCLENERLNTEAQDQSEQLTKRCQELEQKLNHDSSIFAEKEMKMMLDHNSRVQELEKAIEDEQRTYHEYKLEMADLEEKVQNLKHENILLTTKVEELRFNEIDTQEKLKKLQQNYESQVEDLTASQQETKSKMKDRYKVTASELEVATERIADLETQLADLETELNTVKEENQSIRSKIEEYETIIDEKSRLIQQQKNMISKIAHQKDEMALDFEKQEKLFDVELTDRNNKISHLQDMLQKYKKVIDKVDSNLKQLPQEFAIKLMVVEKKLKRERDAKTKAQDDIKSLKRDLLEKESQLKRYGATAKTNDLKAFVEWDMNSFQSQPENYKSKPKYSN